MSEQGILQKFLDSGQVDAERVRAAAGLPRLAGGR